MMLHLAMVLVMPSALQAMQGIYISRNAKALPSLSWRPHSIYLIARSWL